MTRRERLQNRLEKRLDWAESRHHKAESHFNSAHNLTKDIPFGQPILVGHHSEKRHRRTLDRADSNMRNGCESENMAKHHESKAIGIEHQLETSIFSDDSDAIEQLEAKVTALEAERNRNTALNKLIRKEMKTGLQPGWMDRIGATEAEKREIVSLAKCWGSPLFPAYVNANLGGRIRQAKARIVEVQRRNSNQEQAEAAGGLVIKTSSDGVYCNVIFADKPDRSILNELKAAGFHWGSGCWSGNTANIPGSVKQLQAA